MPPLPLSVTIITRNEAVRLPRCLAALEGLAAEIVVVDSGSSDATTEIAAAAGARVIHNDWPGYGPQKRFAEEQARFDWILNLDADEVLSEALAGQIRAAFAQGEPQADGFYLLIRDCDPDEARPSRHAHTTRAVRLYDRRRGRYAASIVHDRVHFTDPDPRLGELSEPVLHYSTLSIEQAVAKLNRYSTLQVEDMLARGRRPSGLTLRLFTEFQLAFLKSYILRGDVLRGRRGFINAMTYAFSRFVRVAKAVEAYRLKRADQGRR